MPKFTVEDEEAFGKLLVALPEDRRGIYLGIPAVNKSAKILAKGLIVILEGKQNETDRRYWRMAEVWFKTRS